MKWYQIQGVDGALAALTTLTLLAACVAAAHPLAALVTARHRLSHRWCATVIIASWLLTSLFYALAPLSAFRLTLVLPLWIVLAGVSQISIARRPEIRGLLGSDIRRALGCLRHPPGLLLSVAGLVVGAIFGLRLMKGLVAPPLAWDALTYHLVKAARWVQQGGWAPDASPDAWRYYEFFPPGGDVLWAWAMLPSHSDAPIAAAGGLAWLMCLVAAYGAARALDAPRNAALATALAIVVMPCLMSFVSSAYVTSVLLAYLLLALTFVLLAIESGRVGDAVLAAAALGLAAGAQAMALPLLGVGVAVLIVAVWWHHGSSTAWRTSAVCLLACAPLLTGYGLTWMRIGSPLYPLALTVGGRTILAGNEQLARVLSGEYLSPRPRYALSAFLGDLFYRVHDLLVEHLNFGAGAIALALLGCAGLWLLLKDRHRRFAAVPLLAIVVLPVAGIMSDTMLSQRTSFAFIAGRFLAPSLAALALVGSIVPGRVASWIRALAILGGAAYAMPRGISEVEWTAMSRVAAYIVGGIAVASIAGAIGWTVRRTAPVLIVGILVGLLLISLGVHSTRAAFRYQIYRAAAGEPTQAPYDLVPLASFLVAWHIWDELDRGQAWRIAFAAGWDGFAGHTAFRYPLLGSRLQNTVVYVPPTRDGEIVDYRERDQLLPRLDFQAWVRRLVEQDIDLVIVAVPGVPELEWMRRYPRVFVPFSVSPEGTWTWAFRVNVAEAHALVDTSAPVLAPTRE